MKAWRYVFLFFALMEISVGIIVHFSSPASIADIHGQADIIREPAMFYVKSFGNAIIGLAILSFWAFLKDNLVLRQACSVAFLIFNLLATYSCLSPAHQASMYIAGGDGHLTFAILFGMIAVKLSRNKEMR
ncbi:MAG: hypothetical protein HRU41_07015 [Saprospiraceae bacterium]|nr:hypothetical protein [Saprospiraceae bacterium]